MTTDSGSRVVRLTAHERRELERLLKGKKAKPRERVRARILLLSSEQWDRESIATATGSSTATVGRVRRRYCDEGCEAALGERERPGSRAKLGDGDRQRLVALACSDPPVGFAKWSIRLLRAEAVRRGTIPDVGRETVRTVLHEHGIKPWREKNVVRSEPR